MSNTITLSQSAYKQLLERLINVEKKLSDLLEKIEREPVYGTDEWWDWSDKKAVADIKKGNYLVFDSPKKLKKHLDSLK
ncbi:MAG: hypothetical protein QHH09_02000 [Microgenomates group bacterium]|nr:hypothetical protein [Microgenomates group bacterium]